MSTRTSPPTRDPGQVAGHALRAPTRPQTYRNLLYLLVSFPLGIAYFVLLSVGFSAGIPLLFVLLGVPVIVLTLVVSVWLAGAERLLVRRLLGVEVPPTELRTDGSLRKRLVGLVTDVATWKAVAYLFTKFAYESLAFGLLGSLFATSASFLLAPLYYTRAPVVSYGPFSIADLTLELLFGWDDLLIGLTTTIEIGSWQVETLPGALLFAGLGVLGFLVAFPLVNGLARLWGRYARVMLTAPRYWSSPKW